MTEPTTKQPCKANLRVAVIGKAPSSKDLAPYDDDGFEIWTLSNLVSHEEVPRFDRHFEIHPPSWFSGNKAAKRYWDWLTVQRGKPIYMHKSYPEIPDSAPYPLDAILGKFGRYFTNTVSWMIALAIHEGAKAIHVYGVDMAQDTEYKSQRPSCEHLLGWAAGAGIDVYVPPQSDLLKCHHLYGFDHDSDFYANWVTRQQDLKKRLAAAEAQIDQATRNQCFFQGALDSQTYYGQWAGGGNVNGNGAVAGGGVNAVADNAG